MQIIRLTEGMTLELKKPHPCGGKTFRLLRVGTFCRVVGEKCGRDTEIDRVKLERAIKTITAPQTQN